MSWKRKLPKTEREIVPGRKRSKEEDVSRGKNSSGLTLRGRERRESVAILLEAKRLNRFKGVAMERKKNIFKGKEAFMGSTLRV